MFHVGQKVVCINDNFNGGFGDETDPVKGGIYTIRDIRPWRNGHDAGFLFFEINNLARHYEGGFMECSYNVKKFKPLEERKTDISSLVALLNPINHKQLEDA